MEANNMAAMREALEFVAHMDEDSYTSYDVEVAVQKAKAALALPLKNCDVGTAEEQYLRMDEYCDKQNGIGPCVKCPLSSRGLGCALGWANMPYESEVKDV